MQTGIFIRVFIASPGDVCHERDEACRVIHAWNAAHSLARSVLIEPVRVETHSHAVQGGHPQDLINGQLLERCDLLVAILWSRLGTPTNSDLSGTVQEVREFAGEKGADHVLLFFCDRDFASSADLNQVQAVRDFKKSVQKEGLYTQYTEVGEFGQLFRHQLDLAMNVLLQGEDFADHDAVVDGKEKVVFLPEANTILAAASMSDRTTIMLCRTLGGHELSAGNVTMNIVGNDRSESKWEAALEQLENHGFVEDLGYKREVFRLTRSGFDAADQIWFIIILRRIESLQSDEHDYVNFADVIVETVFGRPLDESFVRQKLSTLTEMEQIESVGSDSVITAARLNDNSRKTLREHSTFEIVDPDAK